MPPSLALQRDLTKDLRDLDALLARLRARTQWGDISVDEGAADKFHVGLLDEMLELHCTPAGVSVQSDRGWGTGVALEWRTVGAYLRRMMRQDVGAGGANE